MTISKIITMIEPVFIPFMNQVKLFESIELLFKNQIQDSLDQINKTQLIDQNKTLFFYF